MLHQGTFGRWGLPTTAVGLAVFLSILPMAPLPAQQADAGQETPSDVEPQAGTFTVRGGPAVGKIATTTTNVFAFGETAGWITVPGSVQFNVAAGTTRLFNVAYSAECRLINGGGDDWIRIRVVDIVGGVGTPIEPYDANQAFCSADGYATHKGNWAKRVGPGVHTIIVQVWIFDGAPAEALTGWLDDRTLELVVYN